MTRRRQAEWYAGASGRMDIVRARKLPACRYAIQEKWDGSYCRIELDGEGRVSRLLSRTGREFAEVAAGLVGIPLGAPGAVLVGELEAGTEWAVETVKERGYRLVHLFDMVQGPGGVSLHDEPYRARRDRLRRALATVRRPDHSDPRDRRGRHHDELGRYRSGRGPLDWRRFPLVPQFRPNQADNIYERALEGKAEGLVVVNLDAPIGRRGAKVKVKPIESADCIVLAADSRAAVVRWFGMTFTVPANGLQLEPGQCVEVAFEGRYASGEPRFARVVRRRPDKERNAA